MIRILAFWLLLTLPALATQDAVPGLYAVTDVTGDDALNIRAQPDAASGIVGELAPDARGIEVIALSDDARWARVNTGERSGWVARRFLAARSGEWQGRFPSPATCFGTEPFWSLDLTDTAIRLDRLDRGTRDFTAGDRETAEGRRDRWSARAFDDGESLALTIGPAACSDGMSDRAYGLTADVLLSTASGHTHLAGCCSLAPSPPRASSR